MFRNGGDAGTVLCAGLEAPLVDRLRQGLPSVRFLEARSGQEIFSYKGDCDLVLLQDRIAGLPGLAALELLSGVGRRVFYVAGTGGMDEQVGRALQFGAERLFREPVDVSELMQAVIDVLGISIAYEEVATQEETQAQDMLPLRKVTVGAAPAELAMDPGLERIWQKYRPATMAQVDALDQAVTSLRDGGLAPEIRRDAERNAHKLAGACGTFGFDRASDIARQMEKLLDARADLDEPTILRLVDLAVELRASLEGWL